MALSSFISRDFFLSAPNNFSDAFPRWLVSGETCLEGWLIICSGQVASFLSSASAKEATKDKFTKDHSKFIKYGDQHHLQSRSLSIWGVFEWDPRKCWLLSFRSKSRWVLLSLDWFTVDQPLYLSYHITLSKFTNNRIERKLFTKPTRKRLFLWRSHLMCLSATRPLTVMCECFLFCPVLWGKWRPVL